MSLFEQTVAMGLASQILLRPLDHRAVSSASSFQSFGGGVMPRAWRHEISPNHRANKKAKKGRKAQRKARRISRK